MSIVRTILDRLGLGEGAFDDGVEDAAVAAEEAVIDLLELAMLVDSRSAEDERQAIREFVDGRRWPEGRNPYSYADEATSRARSALASHDALEAFLRGVADRLPTAEQRADALAVVAELAEVDGVVDVAEAALLDGLRRRFEG